MSLFDPLTFRTGLAARNRVVLAPMTNKQSHADGSLGDDELRWLSSRAEGGFGVVMTCAAHVAKDGQGWPGELGIFDDALLPGLTTLADAAAPARRGVDGADLPRRPARRPGGERRHALERERGRRSPRGHRGRSRARRRPVRRRCLAREDGRLRRRRAPRRARLSLHAVPQRRAEPPHRRVGRPARQPRAAAARGAARACATAVGPSFTVGVRLSPENFGNAKGLDLDESVQTARWLADDGADFVHLSLWRALEPTAKRPGRARAADLPRRAAASTSPSWPPARSGRAPRPTP